MSGEGEGQQRLGGSCGKLGAFALSPSDSASIHACPASSSAAGRYLLPVGCLESSAGLETRAVRTGVAASASSPLGNSRPFVVQQQLIRPTDNSRHSVPASPLNAARSACSAWPAPKSSNSAPSMSSEIRQQKHARQMRQVQIAAQSGWSLEPRIALNWGSGHVMAFARSGPCFPARSCSLQSCVVAQPHRCCTVLYRGMNPSVALHAAPRSTRQRALVSQRPLMASLPEQRPANTMHSRQHSLFAFCLSQSPPIAPCSSSRMPGPSR